MAFNTQTSTGFELASGTFSFKSANTGRVVSSGSGTSASNLLFSAKNVNNAYSSNAFQPRSIRTLSVVKF